jgi:hypothetical protein
MRHLPVALAAALLALVSLALSPSMAQQSKAPAAPKPYKTITIKLPGPLNDPAFVALRKQIDDIAKRKDRVALAGLVVAKGFFWETDAGDSAAKDKAGIDNLAKAIGLDAKDGSGWDVLASYAAETTAAPAPDREDVVCAPADPTFNEEELEAVTKATATSFAEWTYPFADGTEVRASPKSDAPVIARLGMHLVRIMPDNTAGDEEFMRIVTPAGKVGYVEIDALLAFGGDQLCYIKSADGWKIGGFIGAGQ